jgi:hypothetical protein
MQIPGVHIETLHNPTRYSYAQIEKACTIAALLNRGKLVLVEPPRRSKHDRLGGEQGLAQPVARQRSMSVGVSPSSEFSTASAACSAASPGGNS